MCAHPILFHGTTAFEDHGEPIVLKREFAQARYRPRIYASQHELSLAYAAVSKSHLQTDGFVKQGGMSFSL